MGDRGRLVLPAQTRRRLGLRQGTALTVFDSPSGVVLMTRDQLKARVRASLAGADPVGALLAERRAAASSEDDGAPA
jgi:bifunctional DNA-binding transcriptional regulator/antitoxin component of YhaV-PrlF toxin-antitoxin module